MNQDIISISMENTKMGPIPSFSLPPGLSCSPNAPCRKHGCYAMRMYRRRKTIHSAWDRNWFMVKHRQNDWQRQMLGWLSIYQPIAFRIHVSGDFFCERYMRQWVEIAEKNPNVNFFTFTKHWCTLRDYICNPNSHPIPRNLSVILSAWTPDKNNWCPPEDLMKKFPVAWMEKKARDIVHISDTLKAIGMKRSVSECEGHCATCGKCFKLKRKDGDILFQYH